MHVFETTYHPTLGYFPFPKQIQKNMDPPEQAAFPGQDSFAFAVCCCLRTSQSELLDGPRGPPWGPMLQLLSGFFSPSLADLLIFSALQLAEMSRFTTEAQHHGKMIKHDPKCSMYGICTDIYIHLSQKTPSFVGK